MYYEYVSVALIIQHEKRMRFVILLSMACPTLPRFATSPHNEHHFGNKYITESKMVLIFSKTFFRTISHAQSGIQRDIITNVHWSSCKVPVMLVRYY
jgi:hypothetical protein